MQYIYLLAHSLDQALYCVQCTEGEMGGAGPDSHEPVVTVYIEDNIWDLMQ